MDESMITVVIIGMVFFIIFAIISSLSKKNTVSRQAKEKIMKAKGDCMTIEELLAKKPKLSEVRIIG